MNKDESWELYTEQEKASKKRILSMIPLNEVYNKEAKLINLLFKDTYFCGKDTKKSKQMIKYSIVVSIQEKGGEYSQKGTHRKL